MEFLVKLGTPASIRCVAADLGVATFAAIGRTKSGTGAIAIATSTGLTVWLEGVTTDGECGTITQLLPQGQSDEPLQQLHPERGIR